VRHRQPVSEAGRHGVRLDRGVSGFILLAQPTIYGLIALFPSADIKVLTG